MMKKTLTIAIPTYNAEKYLPVCLDSFCVPEVLEDIEVLVINDGSKDRSEAVAEEYCRKYPGTFRVITKENGGHGSGINCGIANAVGKYFKVVDADDWVDQEAFVNLVSWLKKTDSDLVYTGFYWAFDRGEASVQEFERKAEFTEPFSGVIYKKEYSFDEIAERAYIKMHNMTIRTSILADNGIHIDEHCFYVDTEYISYPIPYVEKVSFLEDFVYQYRIGSSGQSVSMEKMKQNEQHYEKVLTSLFAFYRKLGREISCSGPKKKYLENLFARIVAGKYKIMLSQKASRETKEQMIAFDRKLKEEYPAIYESNINPAVKLLRKSGYLLYPAACVLTKQKYK
jgi:glycosyltransferase involved in cell wall biosynthesis